MHYQILGCCIEVKDLQKFLGEIRALSKQFNVTIQLLDANKIAGEAHIVAAVEKAIRSIERKTNVSQDFGVELLLYASGQRQINRALEIGIKQGRNNAAIVIAGEGEKSVEDAKSALKVFIIESDVLDYDYEKKKNIIDYFNITPLEIEAAGEVKIPKLVLERVALLDISK